jgi:hypothetical protein
LSVRIEYFAANCNDLVGRARDAAVQMLDGRNAAFDHFDRCVKRIEPRIDVAQRKPAREPQFKRMVRRAQLKRGRADMVVRVHKTGRHDTPGAAKYFSMRIVGEGLRLRKDRCDLSVRAIAPLGATVRTLRPISGAPRSRPRPKTSAAPRRPWKRADPSRATHAQGRALA